MAVSTVKGLGNLPTTIEAALQPSTEARIITEPDEPFRIVHVNEVWCRTCGYDAEEVLGQTCKFLHGPGTCGLTLSMLKQALQLKRGLAVQLLNYTKAGRPFTNTLQVAPLYNQSGAVTHYLGVVMARYLDAPPAGTAQQSSSMTTRGQGLPSGGLPSQGPGGFPQGMKTANAPGMSLPGINLGGGYGSYGSGGGMGLLGAVDGSSSGDFTQGGPLTDDFGEGAISPGCGRVPPFLTKLTEILTVEDSEVVTLNANTPSFTICDPQRFAKEVLPRYFKHNKLGSFYQQLHTYGFRRSGTAPDSAVEFHHDQYTGTADEFADWIRQGGAVSKRTVPVRTASQDIPLNVGPHANPFPGLGGGHHGPPNSSAPPPQLLHDMLQVHEGMRQLAHRFQQQKATHAVQLRTILQKLTMRGLLAPESAAYISSLPPQTPMGNGPVGNVPGVGGMPGQNLPGMQNMDLSALAYSGALQGNLGGGNPSNALQAQLDALEAGLLANPLGPGGPMQSDVGAVNVGGSSSLDGVQNVGGMGENRQQTSTRLSSIDSTAAAFLQEDFADPVAFGVHVDNRQPQPYPVGASSSTHGGSHSGASSSKDVTNDLVKLGSDSPPSGQPSEAGGSNTVLTRDSPQGISPPPVTTTAADAAEKVDANSSSAVEAT